MQEKQPDVLLRKIECVSFDVSQYPYLEDFTASLLKEYALQLSELTPGVLLTVPEIHANAMEAPRAFETAEQERILYFSRSMRNEETIFVSMTSGIVGSFGNAMFGGDFNLATTVEASSIDVAILSSVVDGFLDYISRYPFPRKATAGGAAMSPAAPVSLTNKKVTAVHGKMFCALSLDLSVGADKASSAITLYLPIDFLERRGMLTNESMRSSDTEEQSLWRNNMGANINNSKLELDVIIDRFQSNLSDLSNLELGQVIPLDGGSEKCADIILKTSQGPRLLGAGRLGTYKSMKAVKLETDLDPKVMMQP